MSRTKVLSIFLASTLVLAGSSRSLEITGSMLLWLLTFAVACCPLEPKAIQAVRWIGFCLVVLGLHLEVPNYLLVTVSLGLLIMVGQVGPSVFRCMLRESEENRLKQLGDLFCGLAQLRWLAVGALVSPLIGFQGVLSVALSIMTLVLVLQYGLARFEPLYRAPTPYLPSAEPDLQIHELTHDPCDKILLSDAAIAHNQSTLHGGPLSIQLGRGIVCGEGLTTLKESLAHQLEHEFGLPDSTFSIVVLEELPHRHYMIRVRALPVARGRLVPGCSLVLGPKASLQEVASLERGLFNTAPPDRYVDPVTGQAGIWTREVRRAKELNLEVLQATQVLVHHVMDVVRFKVDELLSLDQLQLKLDRLGRPVLVRMAIRNHQDLVRLRCLLRRLLRERISIRYLEPILDTFIEHRGSNDNDLLDRLRCAMTASICEQHADNNFQLKIVEVQPGYDVNRLNAEINRFHRLGLTPILVCESSCRRQLVETFSGKGVACLDKALIPTVFEVNPLGSPRPRLPRN